MFQFLLSWCYSDDALALSRCALIGRGKQSGHHTLESRSVPTKNGRWIRDLSQRDLYNMTNISSRWTSSPFKLHGFDAKRIPWRRGDLPDGRRYRPRYVSEATLVHRVKGVTGKV